jgi:hypothetical protein
MTSAGWLLVAVLAMPGSNDSHKVDLAFESLKACNQAQAIISMQHQQMAGPNARSVCIPLPAMPDPEIKESTTE